MPRGRSRDPSATLRDNLKTTTRVCVDDCVYISLPHYDCLDIIRQHKSQKSSGLIKQIIHEILTDTSNPRKRTQNKTKQMKIPFILFFFFKLSKNQFILCVYTDTSLLPDVRCPSAQQMYCVFGDLTRSCP